MPRLTALLLAAIVACGGPSAGEWRAAQRDVARLKADLDAANKRHAEDEQRYVDAEKQVDDLKEKLRGIASPSPAVVGKVPSVTGVYAVAYVLQSASAPAFPSREDDARCVALAKTAGDLPSQIFLTDNGNGTLLFGSGKKVPGTVFNQRDGQRVVVADSYEMGLTINNYFDVMIAVSGDVRGTLRSSRSPGCIEAGTCPNGEKALHMMCTMTFSVQGARL